MSIEQERQQFIQDEKHFARLLELGNALDIPVLVPIWRIKIGQNGIYHTERKWYARSWVRNAYNAHADQSMGGVLITGGYADGSMSLKRTSGTVIDSWNHLSNPETVGGYFAPVADDDGGIIVGIGTAAEGFDDFELDSLVAEGTMDYQACALDSKGWNGGSLFHWSKWERDINNNSGGTITVTELGMINTQSVAGNILFIRDLLGSSQAVLNTETLTVQCEFRQSFPS